MTTKQPTSGKHNEGRVFSGEDVDLVAFPTPSEATAPSSGTGTGQLEAASAKSSSQEDAQERGDLLDIAANILETDKLESYQQRNANKENGTGGVASQGTQHFEEVGDMPHGGGDPLEQQPAIPPPSLRRQPVLCQQMAQPGAYTEGTEGGLQRNTTLDYQLFAEAAATTAHAEAAAATADADAGGGGGANHQIEEDGHPVLATPGTSNRDASIVEDSHLALADLAVADPVMDHHMDLMHARPVHLDQQEQGHPNQKKQTQTLIFLLGLMLLASSTIVGTVVGTRGKDVDTQSLSLSPTSFSSLEPSEGPSSASTGALDMLLDGLPGNTLASLNNGSDTPQWKAWNWLDNHQNVTNLPEWRKKQLFALATFFYAFHGEHWNPLIKERWMDDNVDECNWFSNGFGFFSLLDGTFGEYVEYSPNQKIPPCNDLGAFTSLYLEGLQLASQAPHIPNEISLLTSLSIMSFSSNQINATVSAMIPTGLSQTKLTRLSFAHNHMRGSMPTELGILTHLQNLELPLNIALTGTIPSEMLLMTGLKNLYLSSCSVSGVLPTEFGLLSHLQGLYLSENKFTGSIPTELWLLTNLSLFNALDNLLTGSLPSELGLVTSLTTLWLSGNSITGTLPSTLGLLTAAQRLHLESNELTGQIPSQLGSLNTLRFLYLNDNCIAGSFPTELGLLTYLEELKFGSNSITGTLPSEIGLILALQKLHANDNLLTGMIPYQLSPSMELRLDGNQLSGTVPSHLCSTLWCVCATNETSVEACADLEEFPSWPGRFPPTRTDDNGASADDKVQLVLNIQTDWKPQDISWVWEQEMRSTNSWKVLDESGASIMHSYRLYSYILEAATTETTYKLLLTDANPNSFFYGWITLVSSSQTVLYSLGEEDPERSEGLPVLSFGGLSLLNIDLNVTIGPGGAIWVELDG